MCPPPTAAKPFSENNLRATKLAGTSWRPQAEVISSEVILAGVLLACSVCTAAPCPAPAPWGEALAGSSSTSGLPILNSLHIICNACLMNVIRAVERGGKTHSANYDVSLMLRQMARFCIQTIDVNSSVSKTMNLTIHSRAYLHDKRIQGWFGNKPQNLVVLSGLRGIGEVEFIVWRSVGGGCSRPPRHCTTLSVSCAQVAS